MPPPLTRRELLRRALATSGGLLVGCSPDPLPAPVPRSAAPSGPASAAPAVVIADGRRPMITYGVQSGDVTSRSAMIWSRANRLARMVVEWDTDPRFPSPRRAAGPVATPDTDFTARLDLGDLPPGQRIHYRIRFEDPGDSRVQSEPASGSFATAPEGPGDVSFCWGGDTAGQGWGIDVARGGMKTYETMRRMRPDFFIHSGDQIYADNPIPKEIPLRDGTLWKNVTTAAKSKVAETLAEFRGNFAYNLLDDNVRRFNAEVASLVQWDDHEIHNNWYPGQVLDDRRYVVKDATLLSERSRQAMFDYTPIRAEAPGTRRIYRSFRRGPALDVLLLDERSYRGPNGENRQPKSGPETAFLGKEQLDWLKERLAASKATWKVIATDMPLSLVVGDGLRNGVLMQEAWANGKGPPLGRELELAELLRFCKDKKIRNLVFVTADVHYAAAHRYDPGRAEFHDFDPFWEFVGGPLHASTFGPDQLDPTFGPEVVYRSPPSGDDLRSPADGGQYFGHARVDGKSHVMTVALHDVAGKKLYSVDLEPIR